MEPTPSPVTRAGLIRQARVWLAVMIIVDVICGTGVFYFLGLARRPHHVVLASIWTAVFAAVVGATTYWLYWLSVRRASSLPD